VTRSISRVLRMLLVLVVLLAATVTWSPAAVIADELVEPQIWAENAVILSDFNEILYDHNAHRRTAPASTTKMMTAIVAARYGNLDMEILIDESDIVGEASMGLWAGETVTLRGLLYGLLLPSGNDAAHAIARTLGWKSNTKTPEEAVQNFVGMMNATVREYQLRNTHFMNPHGLDEWGHYSTPFDLAIILRAALNYPVIKEIMTTRSIHVDGHDLWNGNRLFGMRDDVLGGKTGYTEDAMFCLAAAAYRDGRFVIAVVTRDYGDTWFWDVSNLLDYGLELNARRGIPAYANPARAGTQFTQTPDVYRIRQGSP
jgi:serine-type D-Ala-D-Ala carboxypeptidase (penicillin-binding protein 5/6)